MKNQKLSFENFTSKALSRNQKTTILGGAPVFPEIDEDGNIVNNAGPGGGGTVLGPGGASNSGSGDGRDHIIVMP